jgi:hypothetical protein
LPLAQTYSVRDEAHRANTRTDALLEMGVDHKPRICKWPLAKIAPITRRSWEVPKLTRTSADIGCYSMNRRRGCEMIDLLAVEEPKPKPTKIRAVSCEAAIDQLFKRM